MIQVSISCPSRRVLIQKQWFCIWFWQRLASTLIRGRHLRQNKLLKQGEPDEKSSAKCWDVRSRLHFSLPQTELTDADVFNPWNCQSGQQEIRNRKDRALLETVCHLQCNYRSKPTEPPHPVPEYHRQQASNELISIHNPCVILMCKQLLSSLQTKFIILYRINPPQICNYVTVYFFFIHIHRCKAISLKAP